MLVSYSINAAPCVGRRHLDASHSPSAA